jgi:hypothetical protein
MGKRSLLQGRHKLVERGGQPGARILRNGDKEANQEARPVSKMGECSTKKAGGFKSMKLNCEGKGLARSSCAVANAVAMSRAPMRR